jgi:hypothetical protein
MGKSTEMDLDRHIVTNDSRWKIIYAHLFAVMVFDLEKAKSTVMDGN